MEKSRQRGSSLRQLIEDGSPTGAIRWAARIPGTCTRVLDAGCAVIAAAATIGLIGVVLANLIARETADYSLTWSSEITQLLIEVITFIGGALAFGRGEMPAFEAPRAALGRHFGTPWTDRIRHASVMLVAAVSIVLFIVSIRNVQQQSISHTFILGMSEAWYALPLSVGSAVTAVFAVCSLLELRIRQLLAATGVFVVLAGVMALIEYLTPSTAGLAMMTSLILVLIMILAGVPVGFVLVTAATSYLWKSGFAPAVTVAQSMQSGITDILLLAIPAFLVAGLVMGKSGLGDRLSRLIMLAVGRLPGDVLHAAIVGMYIFSGISGSKLADVAAVGESMRVDLERHDHPVGESSAVLAAAAVMGETIPPSIPLLVLGSITNVSIGGLLLAGILPAAVVGVAISGLIVVVYLRRRRAKPGSSVPSQGAAEPDAQGEGKRLGLTGFLRIVINAVPALIIPVILGWGIIGGIATPSEVSCVAVAAVLILSLLDWRRRPGIRTLGGLFVRSAALAGMVLFIIAGAEAFAFSFASSGLTSNITSLLGSLHDKILFLIIAALVLVILGLLLEGIAAVILFGPILLPIAVGLGVSGYQFGIILILATGLGSFLPPIGVGLFGVCGVMGSTIEQASKEMAKFAVVIGVALLVLILVPQITLAL
jgi:tripartite ATP-independent transporter DctM subunit